MFFHSICDSIRLDLEMNTGQNTILCVPVLSKPGLKFKGMTELILVKLSVLCSMCVDVEKV